MDNSIENNPCKLVDSILDECLTDAMLEKSSKYKALRPEGGSVEEHVSEFCHLEEYLDEKNIIKIFKIQDFKSDIDAEYFIESSNFNRQSTVYIFIRQRKESDNYVIVSFFKKHNIYKGNKAYWMLKEKITGDECIVLYQHPNYKKEE